MSTYFAHISEDGRKQSIEEHLQGTVDRCAAFAKEFGAEEQGRFIGLLHDIGKYSDEFQKRLHGGPRVDHATAGAVESARAGAEWGAFCIAGHHSGIPDGGCLKMDQPGDPTLYGRLKKGLARGIPEYVQNWKNLYIQNKATRRRTPHGVRGLKCRRDNSRLQLKRVAPRTECTT